MLKSNKFLLGLVTSLGFATASTSAIAEIVDTFELGNNFYLLESAEIDGTPSYSVYRYNMAGAGTTVSRIFELTEEPTQLAHDGALLYVSLGKSLYSLNESTGDIIHIRNVITDAIDLVATDNHLIVLQGAPEQGIYVYDKGNGIQRSRAPLPATKDDFYAIASMNYDSANATLTVQLGSADDNETANGSQFIEITLNDAPGVGSLGAITSSFDDLGGAIDAPNGFDRVTYLDDFSMAVDSKGYVVDFSTGDAIFSHGATEQVNAIGNELTARNRTATDGVIDAAADDSNYVYIALTLDNPCNPIGTIGSRVTRRFRPVNFNFLARPFNGYLEDLVYYYDTTNDVHTLAANDNNVFLFHGEGDSLAVEVINDADFNYDYFPWRNPDYHPSRADMSNVRQSTSFSLGGADNNQVIAMQIESGCDHYVGFWDTTTNRFRGYTETFWFNAIDGAYVEALDRIFIAFDDGKNYWVQHMPASESESEVTNNFSITDLFDDSDTLNLLIAAGNYLIVNRTNENGGGEVAAYELTNNDPDDLTNIGTSRMIEVSFIGGEIWTGAVYSDVKKRIYFTTDEGLGAVGFDGDNGAFIGLNGGADESIDYGSVHTIPGQAPILSLNGDESLLFVDAEMYDTDSLLIVDSVGSPANVGLFQGNRLFTFVDRASTFETSTLNADGIYSDISPTNIDGNMTALLPVLSGGNIVPLTLAISNGALNIAINGTLTATTGAAGGTSEPEADDPNADGDSDSGPPPGCEITGQCVQAPGGGGGGPIDLLLLAGLIGLGARQLRKATL